jgi:hypothetical protein
LLCVRRASAKSELGLSVCVGRKWFARVGAFEAKTRNTMAGLTLYDKVWGGMSSKITTMVIL